MQASRSCHRWSEVPRDILALVWAVSVFRLIFLRLESDLRISDSQYRLCKSGLSSGRLIPGQADPMSMSGSNSVVECQLPKLDVAGSTPVSRSIFSIA